METICSIIDRKYYIYAIFVLCVTLRLFTCTTAVYTHVEVVFRDRCVREAGFMRLIILFFEVAYLWITKPGLKMFFCGLVILQFGQEHHGTCRKGSDCQWGGW